MKREEKIAKEYLKYSGFTHIIYEPDGNVTPDFLLDNEIAVEVRRLNKHFHGKPLENLEYSLIPRLRNIVREFDGADFESTDFVSINFSRPLKPSKSLLKNVREIFNDQLLQLGNSREINLGEQLSLKFFPSEKKLDRPFEIAVTGDSDSFGFVVSDIYDSLQIVIEEKEAKILPYIDRYPSWWLVLIDYIGYGINELDLSQLKKMELQKHIFERIVFVPPLNPKGALSIDY